jgi:hypothetical protein
MQDAEPTGASEETDWDRTTERLTEEERQSRYEAHVARLKANDAVKGSAETP